MVESLRCIACNKLLEYDDIDDLCSECYSSIDDLKNDNFIDIDWDLFEE